MAEKVYKLDEVMELRDDGRYYCRLSASYDTQLVNKARNHASVKHALKLAPVVTVVPKRGVMPVVEPILVEEVEEE